MLSGQPLISVILPVYNGETYLSEALESVFQQLYDPMEVIVVDDGSTDGTANVVHACEERIIYLHQQNAGPAAARNAGIYAAKGDLITFIDADDIWPAGKLGVHLEYFRKDPSLEAVIGRIQCLLLKQAQDGKMTFAPFQQPELGVNLGAGMYRKEIFKEIGMLEPQLRWNEDLDWCMRLREKGVPMIFIDAVTLYYRIHTSNMSKEREQGRLLFLQAIKRSLDRRRAGGQSVAGTLPELGREQL